METRTVPAPENSSERSAPAVYALPTALALAAIEAGVPLENVMAYVVGRDRERTWRAAS